MSSVMLNEYLDERLAHMEEKFCDVLRKSLSSSLNKEIPVEYVGPADFDFKELKAELPGEVVFVSMNVVEGGPGRWLFAMTKEAAGVLGDLLLSGDGSAAFSHEEHLEPVRGMLKDVSSAFAAELGGEIHHHIAFEDVKAVLIDLTPPDFTGAVWVIGKIDIGLDAPQSIYRIVSKDFIEASFPDEGETKEVVETVEETEAEIEDGAKEMGLVLDIELPINIELGRTSMLIRDIIKLSPGSIVELDKLSGEPVDLFVNNKRFARGEVVVVDENFAVRITELISPEQRLEVSRN